MFNATTSSRKSWQILKEFANPVPTIHHTARLCYDDPLLPVRVRSIFSRYKQLGHTVSQIRKAMGLAHAVKSAIQNGRTIVQDTTYIHILLAEMGIFRTVETKRLKFAKYYRLHPQVELLNSTEAEKAFQCVIDQVSRRMDQPHKPGIQYRAKLLRYRMGISINEISRLIRTEFRMETDGSCSLPQGLILCQALNINPFWLAAGVKTFAPYRTPRAPACFQSSSFSIPFSSICTPHSFRRKENIHDHQLPEIIAELEGRYGKNLPALLRTAPCVIRKWSNGRNIRGECFARIHLAQKSIFQSDHGFYSLTTGKPQPLSFKQVTDTVNEHHVHKLVQHVQAGKLSNNPYTNYFNYRRLCRQNKRKKHASSTNH